MFQDGLIYRGKRLVNWDAFLQTAVADDEVYDEEIDGHFWTFNYPVVEADWGPGTRDQGRGTDDDLVFDDAAGDDAGGHCGLRSSRRMSDISTSSASWSASPSTAA